MSEMATKETKPLTVYERLLAVSGELESGLAKTGKAAAQQGGYAFHQIDDVEAHLRPLLIRYGLVTVPRVSEMQFETGATAAGKTFTICRGLVSVDCTAVDTGETVTAGPVGSEAQDFQDKGPGKLLSYGLKSIYLALFHLRGQEDNEAGAIEGQKLPACPRCGADALHYIKGGAVQCWQRDGGCESAWANEAAVKAEQQPVKAAPTAEPTEMAHSSKPAAQEKWLLYYQNHPGVTEELKVLCQKARLPQSRLSGEKKQEIINRCAASALEAQGKARDLTSDDIPFGGAA